MDDAQIDEVVVAARSGDEAAFGRLVAWYRPELQLHCYRMLGSLDDAEDAVQDVFLQAWRTLDRFEGRSTVRTWLYRIATNACLARRGRDRRRSRILAATTIAGGTAVPLPLSVPWLQLCPDDLIDRAAARQPDPAGALAARETVEIAFVAALQHLPERQRAVFVLRDVVGWTAEQCAGALDTTVPAVNSAQQRARATLRDHLGGAREAWSPGTEVSPRERDRVRAYADAVERADDAAIAALLSDDVVVGHQPGAGGNLDGEPGWYAGRTTVLEAWAPVLHSPQPIDLRLVEVRSNRQAGVASYIRMPGSTEYCAFAVSVMRFRGDHIAEITNFTPDQVAAFGLPAALSSPDRGPKPPSA